jgi:hypothetical protein
VSPLIQELPSDAVPTPALGAGSDAVEGVAAAVAGAAVATAVMVSSAAAARAAAP